MSDVSMPVNGYGAAILQPPVAERTPVTPKLAGARPTFDPADHSARTWAARGRQFTLDRDDFPRIPKRTWRHIAALQSLMAQPPFSLDENTTNRHLRLLVELLDDSIER